MCIWYTTSPQQIMAGIFDKDDKRWWVGMGKRFKELDVNLERRE